MQATAEQFTLFEIPASEPKRVKSKWDQLNEMRELSDAEGGLVPPFVAAVLLDVSKQRVDQMIGSGIFKRYEFFGKPLLSCKEIAAYANSDRASGRPPATLRETHERLKAQRKEKC